MEALFDTFCLRGGRLDILVHSIAFTPTEDLQRPFLDCSADGFAKAMDISCQSFVRMAKLTAPLMSEGGAMFATTDHDALEAVRRYLACELGPRGIRGHAISPGRLRTRAADGRRDLDVLLNPAAQRAPLGDPIDVADVGFACAYLATPYARRITGTTTYVDSGLNIMP